MRASLLAVAVLLAAPASAVAGSLVQCTIDPDVLGPSAVSWDTSTGVARITMNDHSEHTGRVTRTQDREPRGGVRGNGEVAQAVNLVFTTIGGYDETEFLVYPTGTGSGLFGVSYDHVEGARHLAAHHHSWQADCD